MRLRLLLILLLGYLNMAMGLGVSLETLPSEESQPQGTLHENKVYFGKILFQGKFKENKRLRYIPDYLINIDDVISVKLWGAFSYEAKLKVDSRGNIFIPKVGTIHVLGVSNQELGEVISRGVKRIFNKNVFVYANLDTYQPISIFVTGGIAKPGLYEGLSSDSVLQFIDKAGGILDGEGSYRDITLLRENQVVKRFDLYDFLLNGNLSLLAFKNGDVLKIGHMRNIVEVTGAVQQSYLFELLDEKILVDRLLEYIIPSANVTHFMITSWQDGREVIKKYPLSRRNNVWLYRGEKILFLEDYFKENITIRLEGEHKSLHTLTLPKGINLKVLLSQVQVTPLSDPSAVQLYRKSIAERQKRLIDANLRDLEARVLTTGSATTEEAKIRKEESSMILSFINRAKKVEPKGQVIINDQSDLSKIILEDGDRVFIPKKSQIVVVEGEVSLPNAQTFVAGYSVMDYIESCGGFSPRANKEKVLLVKKSGKVLTLNATSWWGGEPLPVEAGDSILVLGKVDSKNIQITSSVTQILYQIAVGAAVVLRAF